MMAKKIFITIIFIIFSFNTFANTPRSTGKYKNWESFTVETDKGKICFAQTLPTKRAPSSIQRGESKLFVTFRPSETIKDEVDISQGMHGTGSRDIFVQVYDWDKISDKPTWIITEKAVTLSNASQDSEESIPLCLPISRSLGSAARRQVPFPARSRSTTRSRASSGKPRCHTVLTPSRA